MAPDSSNPPDGSTDDWLSLHEASALLGVALSTLRRWSDTGRLPVRRTLGGHRRFQRSAILRLMKDESARPIMPTTASWGVDDRELTRQSWHARFAAGPNAEMMRGLGQRLLGLLMQFINRSDQDERFLSEARAVSSVYGREARSAAVSMHDTVEAFLFFRRSFASQVQPINSTTDLARLHDRLNMFMDAILLETIAGYEAAESS